MRAAVALLALLTLGEIRLCDRLLYQDREAVDFVAESVRGVLEGRPISKSWQQRLLGPAIVSGVARVTGSPERALRIVGALFFAAANLLLFGLARRRGASPERALVLVALFGLVRGVLMYRLEYAWDWIDVLIFLFVGDHVARGGRLRTLWPLLLVGLLSHETVLYVPLWFLLAPLEGGSDRRRVAGAALVLVAMGGAIYGLRGWLNVGPSAVAHTPEIALPLLENHLHLPQNLRQLFIDFVDGRAFIAASLLAALALLGARVRRRETARSGVWSLIVIATIFCFGYINETRHYLPLVAFWFSYAGVA